MIFWNLCQYKKFCHSLPLLEYLETCIVIQAIYGCANIKIWLFIVILKDIFDVEATTESCFIIIGSVDDSFIFAI